MMDTLQPINPISAPRGIKLTDELTGAPAALQLTVAGRQYYYATPETAQLDFATLREVGPLFSELAAHTASVGSQADRAVRNKRTKQLQHDIVAITKRMTQERLVSKSFALAVPAALRWLRMEIQLHGEESEQLIQAYLTLAEANLGLGKLADADTFATKANFLAIKQQKLAPSAASALHRLLGRLYAAQGNYPAALQAFARDIYAASAAFGPEHIEAAGGYYAMAKVFGDTSRTEHSLAFFDKVVDVYYKHLLGAKSAMATALSASAAAATAANAGMAGAEAAALNETSSVAGEGKAGGRRGSASSALGNGARATVHTKAGTAQSHRTGHVGTTEFEEEPVDETVAATAAALGVVGRLSHSQSVTAFEMLTAIHRVRERQLGPTHIATGEVVYTIAMLLLAGGRIPEAAATLTPALPIFREHLGEDHPSTQDVKGLLERLNQLLSDVGGGIGPRSVDQSLAESKVT